MATDVPAVIAQELRDQGFTNVYASEEWPTAPSASLVLLAPSPPPEGAFGAGLERKLIVFQVLTRAQRTGDARTEALNIYDHLRYLRPTGWVMIRPLGQPFPIGQDEDGRPQYSANYVARIHE